MQSVELKEMPFHEKFEATLDFIDFYESFVPVFVRERLGDEAEVDLRRRWREGTELVSEDASAKERYESAYRNFISMARTNFAFIREHMDEDGMSEFVETEVEALKRHNASLTVTILNLIRTVSKSTAFKMLVNQSAYDLQWITPGEMTEFSAERAVIAIPSCKILDYPDTDDICYIGCQQAFPQWVAEQFKADMSFDRQGKRCTCTLKPLA
jgi:hypothetical protein